MKTMRFYTLLALLLMAGGVTMQAQEQCNTDRPTGLFACQKAPDAIPFKQPTVVSVQDAWLHYGSEVYGSNLAYSPQEIPFSWAVSFPPSVLQSYDGFTLTRVAIYENYYIMGNLILGVYYGNEFMPLTLLDEQVFAPTGNEGFTDIVLDNPVELDVTKHLWIVFSETDMTETFSAAVCYDDSPDPNARWVQMEENKWADVASYGPWERLQFMIWAYITDDPWGVEESLLQNTSSVYPTPGGNTLNIRTALQNARVEVYDMNGRLVHSQALTEHVTAIDAGDWAEGVYVWKVYVGGPSTGSGTAVSGTLVEKGKWVKE